MQRGDEMNRYEKAKRLQDEDFKRITGVAKTAFDAVADILSGAYAEKHKRRGRHAKLSIQGQLFIRASRIIKRIKNPRHEWRCI
jgi:hypothetical protein